MTPFGIRKKLKTILGTGQAPASKSATAAPVWPVIFVLPEGTEHELQARPHASLAGISAFSPKPIATGCNDGKCGTCAVEILDGADQLLPEEGRETRTKKKEGIPAHQRLACQALVQGPGVRVQVLKVLGEDVL